MEKKRKILMIHPIIAPYRIDMVNELAKNFDLSLCLYANNLQGQKFDIEQLYKERLNVRPTFLLDKKYAGKINMKKAVVEAIRNYQPDVVIVSEFNKFAWVVLAYRMLYRAKYKVVSMVDDCIDMLTHPRVVFIRHSIVRMLIMPLLDQIIVVDSRAVEWYKRKYGKGIFFPVVSDDVIYRERLQRVLPLSEEYVEKYHLEGKKILMFVGRLSSEKNLPMAIEAFKQVGSADSVFLIIGDGPERIDLYSKYGNEKSVMLLGRYEGDALYAWYNICQVFILPSVRETFGAVVNEALMAGCEILLSKVAGSGCLIEETRNGNFISPSNSEDMSNYIAKSLESVMPLARPLKVKSNRMLMSFRDYIGDLIKLL